MPFHSQLSFEALHKAKFEGGLDANLPANPEGFGDAYWAPDGNSSAGALYLTTLDGADWFEFTGGGSGGEVTQQELQDAILLAVFLSLPRT
jgi:hypothetical protein